MNKRKLSLSTQSSSDTAQIPNEWYFEKAHNSDRPVVYFCVHMYAAIVLLTSSIGGFVCGYMFAKW